MPPLPKIKAVPARVLIIDDNSYNLDICHEYISSGGYDAICADGSVAGIQYLEQHGGDVDLILLDRKMPVMDGVEMLSHLQADVRFKDIPVIIVTADLDQKLINAGKRAGVASFVTKPFTRKEILFAANEALFNFRQAAAK